MGYKDLFLKYLPVNVQEEQDRKTILSLIETYGDFLFDRNCLAAHFSSSAWITNKTHDKVLMNWHNIYKNWGWLGGHNDGCQSFDEVAMKEALEESGLMNIAFVTKQPISIEILPVTYHMKKGKFVSSHIHLNVTYLFEADETEELHIKPDENSGLKWVPLDDAPIITNEEAMKPIYQKLNEALRKIDKRKA